MGSRTWIKIYPENWLKQTLRQETPELRGFWMDVLALAGNGTYGDSGEIKLADNVGLTDAQIAGIFKVPVRNWLKNKARLIETERISCNGTGIITILNWSKYQSEYTRQRSYREEYEKRKVTTQSYNAELQRKVRGEREGEREGERDKKETNTNPPIIPLQKGDVSEAKLKRKTRAERKAELADRERYKKGKFGHLVQH